MSSSDSEMAPDSVKDEANTAIGSLLPEISKERYLNTYNDFMNWRELREIKSFSESVFLTYFNALSGKIKPSTLWSRYSMLKCTLRIKHNVDFKKFHNLSKFLKGQSQGFNSTKTKVFTSEEVETFLNEAPDEIFLAAKVALILGLSGACSSNELTNLTINDFETQGQLLLVTLAKTTPKTGRTFVVREEFTQIVKKYQELRPIDIKTDRFFLNYQKGKCLKQVIGKNKISSTPKQIATYLSLPNCEQYTGHCFRSTSATLLAGTRPNVNMLIRHSGRKFSAVEEEEDPLEHKPKISKKFETDNSENLQPTSPQASSSNESEPCSPSSDQILESQTFTDIEQSQIGHNISSCINIPNKNVNLSFTNCSNISFNFK